jgi:hypothetical protein
MVHPSTHSGVIFTAVAKGLGINQTAVKPYVGTLILLARPVQFQ